MTTNIFLFQGKTIRRSFHHDEWWFSVVDVIAALSDSTNPRDYWYKMKIRVQTEDGAELSTFCRQLKLESADGKMYETDCSNTEGLFRIIQSIPSPKAEPFKLWLAKVGYERIEEMEDPELAFERAMRTYLRKGYSKEWINQRLKTIEVRKELTDEWQERGMKEGLEFAILTDEITKAWSGKNVRDYKNFKNLKKEGLRDNMTNLELILNMLAEATTTEISKEKKPQGLHQSREVAKRGGRIAGNTRKEIEKETGGPVVTPKNAKELQSREMKNKRIQSP